MDEFNSTWRVQKHFINFCYKYYFAWYWIIDTMTINYFDELSKDQIVWKCQCHKIPLKQNLIFQYWIFLNNFSFGWFFPSKLNFTIWTSKKIFPIIYKFHFETSRYRDRDIQPIYCDDLIFEDPNIHSNAGIGKYLYSK